MDHITNDDETSSSADKNGPQYLLSLLRTIEKTSPAVDKEVTAAALESILTIRKSWKRGGLLQGDTTKAGKTGISSSSSQQQPGRKKRRKNNHNAAQQKTAKSSLPEEMWFTAFARVMGGRSKTNSEQKEPIYPPILIEATCDAMASLCDCNHHRLNTLDHDSPLVTCARAEMELISVSCPRWLTLLAEMSEWALLAMDDSASYFGVSVESHSDNRTCREQVRAGIVEMTTACLRTSASIVRLVGTRLSRSPSVSPLQSVAWCTLGCDSANYHPKLSDAAAALAAALPLTGNSGQPDAVGVKPSVGKLWSEALGSTLRGLCLIATEAFPQRHGCMVSPEELEGGDGDTYLATLKRHVVSQTVRTGSIRRRIQGLVTLVTHLLSLEGYDTSCEKDYIVPLPLALEAIGRLVRFGSDAALVMKDKSSFSRREIPPNGALLSPRSAVGILGDVRILGHELLGSLLGGVGGSSLLRRGRDVVALVLGGLNSSFSRDNDDWPGALRVAVVKSVRSVLVTLGTGVVELLGDGMVTVAVDSYQMLLGDGLNCKRGTTLEERLESATETTTTLTTFLSVGSSHIPPRHRSPIEFALSNLLCTSQHFLATRISPELQTALLNLGTAIICTPWNDGGSSTLSQTCKNFAELCKSEGMTEQVRCGALTALAVSHTVMTPRVPPLEVIAERRLPLREVEDDVLLNRADRTVSEEERKQFEKMGMDIEALTTTDETIAGKNRTGDWMKGNAPVQDSDTVPEVPKTTTVSGDAASKPLGGGAIEKKVVAEQIQSPVALQENKNISKDALKTKVVPMVSVEPSKTHDSDGDTEMFSSIPERAGEKKKDPLINNAKDATASKKDLRDNNADEYQNKQNDDGSSDEEDLESLPDIVDCDPDEQDM